MATVTPPLSGPDAAILELLRAGRSFDDVCEIGRYRKTWPPSVVHRVVSQYLPHLRPARVEPTAPMRQAPVAAPGHGTASRYRLHHKQGDTPCEPCRLARNEYERDRRNLPHNRALRAKKRTA